MKLLLDESVDRALADHFPERYEIKTVSQMGWSGTSNGELLRIASDARCEAVITVDKDIEFQQSLSKLPIAVIVLITQRSVIDYLKPLVPEVTSALEAGTGKKLIKIQGPENIGRVSGGFF